MGSANGRHSQKKGTKALPFQKVHCFVYYLLLKGAYKYLKAIYWRFSTAWYGTVRLSLHFHRSLVPL